MKRTGRAGSPVGIPDPTIACHGSQPRLEGPELLVSDQARPGPHHRKMKLGKQPAFQASPIDDSVIETSSPKGYVSHPEIAVGHGHRALLAVVQALHVPLTSWPKPDRLRIGGLTEQPRIAKQVDAVGVVEGLEFSTPAIGSRSRKERFPRDLRPTRSRSIPWQVNVAFIDLVVPRTVGGVRRDASLQQLGPKPTVGVQVRWLCSVVALSTCFRVVALTRALYVVAGKATNSISRLENFVE